MKLLVKNGLIATDTEVFSGDLFIENETVRAIGQELSCPEAEILDASGCYVLPGGVDVHTHMDLDVGTCRAVDDFYDGTVGAACGGTTTIVDHMAFGPKDCSLWHQVKEYHRLADGKAVVDYGFHGVLQHVHAETLAEMREIAQEEGITSFKAYLTYDGRLRDGELLLVFRAAKEAGIVIAVHCENHGVIQYLRETFVSEGKTAAKYHPLSRPARCEAEAVNRVIHLAAMAGDAPLYVVHLSSAEGLREVRKARAEGLKGLGVETCPQYLLLTDGLYEDPQEGLKAVMSPPLRKKADNEALWQALARDELDVVGTDHCPFRFAGEKQFGAEDFTKCPNGAPGVEERLSLMFSEGFMKGRLTLPQVVKYCCANPARMYGLYPKKGTFLPGADADLVLIDPSKRRTLTHASLHGAADYTCYEGMELQGVIRSVYLRGRQIVKDNVFLGQKGDGRYLKRGRSVLAQ